MKKIFLTLLIIFLSIGILAIPTNYLLSQYTQYDIQSAVRKVLSDGILYPFPESETVYFNSFFELPDTTSNGSWDIYGSAPISYTLKLSTTGYYRKFTAYPDGGGILLMFAPMATGKDTALFNIQMKSGVILKTAARRKTITFKASIVPQDSLHSMVAVGLFRPDADSLIRNNSTAGIYFQKLLNDTIWTFNARTRSTTVSRRMTKSFINKNNLGFTNFKFIWSDTNLVVPYINGIADSSITTYLPKDSILVPSFEIRSDSLAIQYLEVRQIK